MSAIPIAHIFARTNAALSHAGISNLQNGRKLTLEAFGRIKELLSHPVNVKDHLKYSLNDGILTISSTSLVAAFIVSLYADLEFILEHLRLDYTIYDDDLLIEFERLKMPDYDAVLSDLTGVKPSKNYYFIVDLFKDVVRKALKADDSALSALFTFAIHECFDRFNISLSELIGDHIKQVIDEDMLPRRKTKQCIVPRGKTTGDLIHDYIMPSAFDIYTHHPIDIQPDDLVYNYDEVLDQAVANTLNSCNFFIRLFPTNWTSGKLTAAKLLLRNRYSIAMVNRSVNAIHKRHEVVDDDNE